MMGRFTVRFFITLLTFAISLSGAAFSYSSPHVPHAPDKPVSPQNPEPSAANLSAWQVLLSFEGQDLRKLDQKSAVELSKAIDTLVGRKERELLFPRLFSAITNAQGDQTYELIEESPLISIPGNSGIRAHVFSPEGRLINSSAFSSGWRITPTEIKVTYVPEIGREVLEVSSEPLINGRDIAKQYYGLIGGQVLLVRLEDSAGRIVRNTYGAPNHTIGLTLTGRSAREWEKALASTDSAEVLAALTWLSGTHLNPLKPAPDYSHEEIREARLVDEVRSREGVKAALTKLVRAENKWVRSAAELATKVEYYQ